MANGIIVKGLGIGVDEIDSSAVIDIASTASGILIPRMTTIQRDAISSPATGLKIFNATSGKENVYSGVSWEEVVSGESSIWSGNTTDDTPTEIFIGGVTNARFGIQAQSSSVFKLICVARNNSDNKTKVWDIAAVVQRDASNNSALVGTPSYTVIAESDEENGTQDWDISVAANDADDTFRITATGESGKSISWGIRG